MTVDIFHIYVSSLYIKKLPLSTKYALVPAHLLLWNADTMTVESMSDVDLITPLNAYYVWRGAECTFSGY